MTSYHYAAETIVLVFIVSTGNLHVHVLVVDSTYTARPLWYFPQSRSSSEVAFFFLRKQNLHCGGNRL